jgi:signal transduction histidine kinase
VQTALQDPRLEAFVQMLAHVREPILLVTNAGKIVTGNIAAAEVLATSVAALGAAALDDYAPEPLAGHLAAAAQGEGSFHLRARDGSRVVGDASQLGSDLFVVRLTGAPEVSRRASALFDMYARIHGMASPRSERVMDELSHTLLALGMTTLGSHAGAIFLLDTTGQMLELVGSIGYSPESVDRYRLVPLAARMPLTDAVRTGTWTILATRDDYAARYPAMVAAYPQAAHHALAGIPLEVDGRCIGAIALSFPPPWQITDEERAFLVRFGRESARAIDRVKIANGERETAAVTERVASHFQRLIAFSSVLAQAITPSDVAEAAVDAGMATVGARSAGLWLASGDATKVSLARAVGPTGPLPEAHKNVPLDRASRMPILDAIRDGAPVWIESCAQLAYRYPDVFRAFSRGGESSLACLPLLAQGRCIGGIAYNFAGAREFLEDERAFFQVLSWYVAQALERARLYASERLARSAAEASHRRSAFLAETDGVVASLDADSTLAAVAAAAVPRIADWCIVQLEEHQTRGTPPIGAHVDPAKLPAVIALSRIFRERGDASQGATAVMNTGKSMLYSWISPAALRASTLDRDLVERFLETGAVSSMVVPIQARGRTIGSITLTSADPARRYDKHDLAMAEELGRKVGLALENARLYREVRDADRLKDEFLSMLSHELRNPLVPIMAAVDLMRLDDAAAFAQERGLIERNAHHLVRLIDDLLDVSRITRGKVQLDKGRFEVADLVGDAVDIAFPHIEERHHRLMLAVPPHGMVVIADRMRIAQSIANLLINAARYTEPGGSIGVTAEAQDGHGVIRVRDSGIGITPDLLPRVFDLFVQGAGRFDRAQGGLGVGLTIVKSLVELHGGTVSARSEGHGKGSEFEISLPLAPAGAPVEVAAPTRSHVAAWTGRVLVVDDNREAADVLARLLQVTGCTTLVAYDATSALAEAPSFRPELALLDLALPDADGYALASELRMIDPTLRIVAITGFGQASDRARSRAAGFADHLVKPIDLATLRRVLASRG